jgi:hypothetical protein
MQVLADMGEQLALPAAWTSGIDQLSGPPREYALDKTKWIPTVRCELAD